MAASQWRPVVVAISDEPGLFGTVHWLVRKAPIALDRLRFWPLFDNASGSGSVEILIEDNVGTLLQLLEALPVG